MTSTITMLSIIIKLIFLVVLLVFTVFFVAAETSLTYLRKSQTKRLIREKGVVKLNAWLENPNRLLTTTLAGTAMSVIGVSVMGTSIALDLSGIFNISPALTTSVSTLVLLVIVLVFSEIVPKAYARRNARRVSASIIGPLRVVDFILTPFINIFLFLSDIAIRAFPAKEMKKHSLFAREELKGLIEVGSREGILAGSEKRMLKRIMEFSGTVVREIMVPRVAAKILDSETGKKELIEQAIETGHSRLPVYRGLSDKIIGILYIKDLMEYLSAGKDFTIEGILRKPYFVPETKPAADLLKEFKTGREHMAIVVDEYGSVAGIITIEDIVEEITGEIYDEYDKSRANIYRVGRKTWEINAIEDLDNINDKLGLELPEDIYDSLGGLIVGELGRVPSPGDILKYGKCTFTVLDSTPSRVIKAKLKVR